MWIIKGKASGTQETCSSLELGEREHTNQKTSGVSANIPVRREFHFGAFL